MISITERMILMAFVRDWYATTSNEYTGETRKLLLGMSDAAGEVFNELHGMYAARTDEDEAAE